ncbi:MAG: type IV pilin-like G/H family protein [Prochlorothrix sp.]
MKSEFQAKFLQNLLKKRENEGFTLIELLVVIIIIGILSAIALPSFLNQANKARESEAKQYTGSMNRAQQAYYLEEQEFTSDFAALGMGIATQTTNYVYVLSNTNNNPTSAATVNPKNFILNTGNPIDVVNLRAFVGVTDVITSGGATTTIAALCQTIDAGDATSADFSSIVNSASDNSNSPNCSGNSAWEQLD